MSDIVNDPDFAQLLTAAIHRDTGTFVLGKWKKSTTDIDFYGIVQPSTAKELKQVPEGDRVTNAMSFHSQQPLYVTHAGEGTPPDGISDTITWQGQLFKLIAILPWNDFGYYLGIGVRISGQ